MERIAARIAKLGWHIVIYFEHADLDEMGPFLKSLPTTLVFDHMACPNVKEGVDGKHFQNWLKALDANKTWITKVTCPERFTVAGPPYDDVVPFARAIVERFPDRVIWGTDWPHPEHAEGSARRRRAGRHDPEDRADRRRCSRRCWSTIRCGSIGAEHGGNDGGHALLHVGIALRLARLAVRSSTRASPYELKIVSFDAGDLSEARVCCAQPAPPRAGACAMTGSRSMNRRRSSNTLPINGRGEPRLLSAICANARCSGA